MPFTGMPPSQAPHRLPSLPQPVRVSCFSIAATADPSVLPRILDMIAMFDLIPERCHVSRSDQEPGRPLMIDLQIADLGDEDAHLIEKKLERMVLITQILCSEKRRAAA
ncbi:MAG: hypothetical protein ACR2P3_06520 [Geminicoccaceae bacterium]